MIFVEEEYTSGFPNVQQYFFLEGNGCISLKSFFLKFEHIFSFSLWKWKTIAPHHFRKNSELKASDIYVFN